MPQLRVHLSLDFMSSIVFLLGFPDSSVGKKKKNPPAMPETLVQFLGQEDPLEKGWATHSSVLGLPLWLSW